jgi:hypothetical protein
LGLHRGHRSIFSGSAAVCRSQTRTDTQSPRPGA